MKLQSKAGMFTISAAVCAAPMPALAWGRTGHAAIAIVAQNNLQPAVLSEVQGLLALELAAGQREMWRVASWADDQRALVPMDPNEPVHSVRIPFTGTPPTHACPDNPPYTPLCADEAVDHYGAVLANRSLSAAVRLEALKYVIHMVGDLHQPLHGSDPIGYNYVYFKTTTARMIHSIWDNDVVTDHTTNGYNLAAELSGNGISVTVGGTPRDWATESSVMARDHIFNSTTLPACWSNCPTSYPTLPVTYSADKYPLAAQRMKQAGLRLGALINDLLTP